MLASGFPHCLQRASSPTLMATVLPSDSPWAKASAVSYDVVAMERWMNVLLAQRLDGCAPVALSWCPVSMLTCRRCACPSFRSRLKLEQVQRRIDQAIGEELRAANSAGEVRPSSHATRVHVVIYTNLDVTAIAREPRKVEAAESRTRPHSC